MTTQNRPYQGYPYVNPVVIDVPSIDSTTAAKWSNLPRKPIGLPVNNSEAGGRSGTSRTDADNSEADSTRSNRTEDTPVVYIDVPDSSASSVLETPRDKNEQRLVQETILYDPFKERRIELRITSDDSEDEDAPCRTPARNQQHSRPVPPSTLQISSPGGSGYTSSPTFGSSANPNLPAFMTKEAGYYGRQPTPDDGFPLSPIPVTDFPEPPPAYSEIDRVNQTSAAPTTPPRTEVVTTVTDPTTTVRPGSDRKLLQCQHCNQRVHSLVVRESGAFTHILALIFAFLCIPIVLLIYCTEGCKYKNHYCPNCNQLIGYEIPLLCQEMAYV